MLKALMFVMMLLIAVGASFSAALGSIKIVGGWVGLLLAGLLLFFPSALFSAVMVFSLVISGLAEFYLGIGQSNWVASILAFALIITTFFSKLNYKPTKQVNKSDTVKPLVFLYVILFISTSLLNSNPIMQIVVGLRNYIPFIGVFLALQFLGKSDKNLKGWIYTILVIAVMQLPFCLHEAIFIAPLREHSLVAVGGGAESIVGTFGGDPFGGGYTGEMAVFMLIASCLAVVLSPSVRFGKILAWLVPLSAVICVALAETKIVFLLTPFVLVLVFFEDLKSSPKKMFIMLITITFILGIIATVYAWRFWSVGGADEFWHAFTYSFDPNFMVDKFHRGRVGALVHWWDKNITMFDPMYAFFGYGMGSTLENSSVLGQGNAVKIFGLGLDAHAANKLLWDGGIIIFCIVLSILIRTGLNAHKAISDFAVPMYHKEVLKVIRASMFCFTAMLPYQISIVGGAPMQFLFWFFVGYVEYWQGTIKKGSL